MSYSSPADILADADTRGLRRALIITALPIEMQAVRAHLRHVGSCLGPDGRVYECGQFTGHADGQTAGKAEEWLVVVAESSVGTHAAQSVVNYAHQMFRPFEVMIFVGVAKSQKKEIPIGSVVVSNVVHYPYSGKYADRGFDLGL